MREYVSFLLRDLTHFFTSSYIRFVPLRYLLYSEEEKEIFNLGRKE